MAFSDPEFDAAVAAAGLNLRREPLAWYVDKLRRGEPFSLARYGDGELYCMLGEIGVNGNGCRYNPVLAAELRASLGREDPDYYYGLQRVLPEDVAKFATLRDPRRPWLDTEVFSRTLLEGGLYPLVKQLRCVRTVLVANRAVAAVTELLWSARLIEVPPRDSYTAKERIVQDILSDARHEGTAYLFSAGMGLKPAIAELHGRVGRNWLLDLGHVWDIFAGLRSRTYLETIPKEVVRRNLEPCS